MLDKYYEMSDKKVKSSFAHGITDLVMLENAMLLIYDKHVTHELGIVPTIYAFPKNTSMLLDGDLLHASTIPVALYL